MSCLSKLKTTPIFVLFFLICLIKSNLHNSGHTQTPFTSVSKSIGAGPIKSKLSCLCSYCFITFIISLLFNHSFGFSSHFSGALGAKVYNVKSDVKLLSINCCFNQHFSLLHTLFILYFK